MSTTFGNAATKSTDVSRASRRRRGLWATAQEVCRPTGEDDQASSGAL